MGREDRLPKWAQDELEGLRRQLRDAEQAFKDVAMPWDEAADILIGYQTTHGHSLGAEPVSFLIPRGGLSHRDRITARVGCEGRASYLDIHSNYESLRIEPRACNSVRIYLEAAPERAIEGKP